MGIDCLALLMVTSPNKNKTEALIMKELEIEGRVTQKKGREELLFESILSRVQQNALPELTKEGIIVFKPMQEPSQTSAPSANFIQYK
jgi:hypothetical protein